MGFVVELTSRSGRVDERFVFKRSQATIGRAYDNDVIVADPYMAAHHARITSDLNGMAVEVLDADAHSEQHRQVLALGRMPIQSGAELILGRTHLRVLSPGHPVAATRAFERLDRWMDGLTQPILLFGLGALFLLVSAGAWLLETHQPVEFADVAVNLLSPVMLVLGWALVWAVITRISKGEPRFFHHLLAAIIYSLIDHALDWVVKIVAFNFGSPDLVLTLEYLFMGFSISVLLALSLREAFRQGVWVRQAFAQGVAWSVVVYSVLTTLSITRDFSVSPEFEATLLPDSFHFSGSEPAQTFVDATDALFEFAERSEK